MRKPELRISIGTIKDFLIIALIATIAWKLVSADLSFSFDGIKTNDLLSFFLALFAIGVSIAFFVKANQVSNMFYDNMYKFTKDNSELLGRMEAGFSEQLRHLDQGYSGLSNKFDKLPFDLGKTEEKVEGKKATVKKSKKEIHDAWNTLAEKANLPIDEKEDLFSKLRQSEKQMIDAQVELKRLQRRLQTSRNINESTVMNGGLSFKAIEYTAKKVMRLLDPESTDLATDGELANAWSVIKGKISPIYLKDLRAAGMIDSSNNLNQKGLKFLRNFQDFAP